MFWTTRWNRDLVDRKGTKTGHWPPPKEDRLKEDDNADAADAGDRALFLEDRDAMETQLEKELRAAVGRVTPQRRLITSILQEQGHHLSAEEILLLGRRKQPRLSLATVYRTLRRLKDSGLVRELRLTGDRRQYEFIRGEGHQHLVCLECGKVVEFVCSHTKEIYYHLADQHKFKITSARVRLIGYCVDCQARMQKT
jgi:Fur family ferric uptake transcriptional regulator